MGVLGGLREGLSTERRRVLHVNIGQYLHLCIAIKRSVCISQLKVYCSDIAKDSRIRSIA